MLRSLGLRVLLALVAGLGLGVAAAAYGGVEFKRAIEIGESLGELWLNGLRMTVVPLLFSVLVVGIAGVADAAATGRLAGRAIAWFAGFLAVGCIWTLTFSNSLYAIWPLAQAGADSRAAATRARRNGSSIMAQV